MRTFGRVELSPDEKHWIITEAEPHVSIKLKTIFRSIPRSSVPPYRLPHTLPIDSDLDWFMMRYPLMIDPRDRAKLDSGREAYLREQAEIERILMPDYTAPILDFKEGYAIRPYQMQAVELAKRRKSLLVGDEVGLGKTITAAGFMVSLPEAMPAAVVCDAHMQRQWRDKLQQFTNLTVHIIKQVNSYELPKADVYIFRISQVSGWANIFETGYFKSVIYDEPQSLRTGTTTNKGVACKVLSNRAEYRIGLTATPVYNYGEEMWRIMQFIDPGVLGEWEDFAREWCKPFGSGKHKVDNPKALGSYLREQNALIRRTKFDVGQQLPKVSRIVEYIDYDSKAVEEVESLARMLALKASTGTFVERGNAVRELDIRVRQATGVSKAKSVANFTRLIVEAGEPVVLFGWHRDVYDIWMRELADLMPELYTGSESVAAKEKAKSRFMAGETDILIMSLRSGAGVDGLQHRCCTEIFGELDWSPGIHHQCIGRVDREGQKNPVTAFFLVTNDGSDPPMMDVLGVKSSEAKYIIDPYLGVETNENDTARLQKLVDRYLDRKSIKI